MASLLLKNLPEDIRRLILKQQAKEKASRGTNQFSMELTIYKIIREWDRCKEGEKNN